MIEYVNLNKPWEKLQAEYQKLSEIFQAILGKVLNGRYGMYMYICQGS